MLVMGDQDAVVGRCPGQSSQQQRGLQPPGQLLVKASWVCLKPQILLSSVFPRSAMGKRQRQAGSHWIPQGCERRIDAFTPSPFLVWFLLHPSLLPVAALPWPGLSGSDRAHCLLGSLPGEGQALAPSQFKSEFTLKALKKLCVDPLPSLRHPEES